MQDPATLTPPASSLAERLIDAGIPVIVCKPNPDYDGTNRELIHPPNWQSIDADEAALAYVRTYNAETDTLAMVGGHGIDALDIDTKIPGVVLSDIPDLIDKSFGVTVTPSGGFHLPVRSTGYGKGKLAFAGKMVGDYVGGTASGGGRGLLYLPGSNRPKYPDRQYVTAKWWDIDKLLDGEPDDFLITCLAACGLSTTAVAGRPSVDDQAVRDFIEGHRAKADCSYGRDVLRGNVMGQKGLLGESFTPGDPVNGLHQWMARSANRIVELMTTGCLDSSHLDEFMEAAKKRAGAHPEKNRWKEYEFINLLQWAIANTDGRSGCKQHDPRLRNASKVKAAPVAPAPPPPAPDFWERRDWLKAMHKMAHHHITSPMAMASVFLARYASSLDPSWELPMGGSLNMFVAVLGAPGSGKSTCMRAVNDLKPVWDTKVAGLGSGEGLAAAYGDYDSKLNKWVQHETAVMFTADEVGTIAAVSARSGSTLVPLLNTAWSGGQLGMAYRNKNARFDLAAHKYRMCLVAGVQPQSAQALFDHRGIGFSQRFLWTATNHDWEEKGPRVNWSVPKRGPGMSITYVQEIENQIVAEMIARGKTAMVTLDNPHRTYIKCKVAALTALLDMRTVVSLDDWDIAEVFLSHSDDTIAAAKGLKIAEAAAKIKAESLAEHHREQHREAYTVEATAEKLQQHMERCHSDRSHCNKRHAKTAVAVKGRASLGAAFEVLVDSGIVAPFPGTPRGTNYRLIQP